MKIKRVRIIVSLLVIIFLMQVFQFNSYAEISLEKSVKSRLSNSLVLYQGSSLAYRKNTKTYMDSGNLSIKPIMSNGRTLVPVRFFAESLGAVVKWNDASKTVTLTKGSKTIRLAIGSKKININGKVKTMDTSAVLSNGRTFVPLRAISEAFGKKVFYDRGLIVVSDKNKIFDPVKEKNMVDSAISWFAETELTLKQIAAMETSVVVIEAYNGKGELSQQGSGFCVGKGLFLTNYHVIEDCKSFRIITSDGKEHAVEGVVRIDEDRDLAILKTRQPLQVNPLKIGSMSMLEKADRIVTIGSPEGLQNTISDGIVSGLRNIEGIDLIQITAPVTHGSSGGPLINMYGYVVGVVTLGSNEGNLNFAVPIDYVQNWLKQLGTKSFSQIGVMDGNDLVPMDDSVSDEELEKVVRDSFSALQNENIDTYMSSVSDVADREKIREAMQIIFDTYSLRYTLESVEVISKTAATSKLKYVYSVRKVSGPEFYDCRIEGKIILVKEKGKWKISDSTEQVVEYLDGAPGSVPNPTKPSEPDIPDSLPSPSGTFSTKMNLNFAPSQVRIDPVKPVLYMLDKENNMLRSVNYETGIEKNVQLDYLPECMDVVNGTAYIGLLRSGHKYSSSLPDKGTVVVVETENMAIRDKFDVDVDPFDIAADRSGNIIISNGSNQHTKIKSYSLSTKKEVGSAPIYMQSYIEMHPVMDKLYSIDTALSPRDMSVYDLASGAFPNGQIGSVYHGDYDLSTEFELSPDGKFIFNAAGTIFACSEKKSEDMRFVHNIKMPVEDFAFGVEKNRFYAALKAKYAVVFSYDLFEPVETYKMKGSSIDLFNRENKLISVSKSGENEFIIETMEVGNTSTPSQPTQTPKAPYIKLPGKVSDTVYDAIRNKAYSIDPGLKKLYITDLNNNTLEKVEDLLYRPSGISISEEGNKLLVVNNDTEYLMTEYDLNTFSVSRQMNYELPADWSDEVHRHIYDKDGKLYLVTGDWSPKLMIFDEKTFKRLDCPSDVDSIGDIRFTADGEYFYSWHQYGWSAGWAGSNVYKYSLADATVKKVDESTVGYPEFGRDPLDAPLFLLEKDNLLICKQMVFKADNLTQAVRSFPEPIYAVNQSGTIAVGKEKAYDIKTGKFVAYVPKNDSKPLFFGKNDILYVLKDNVIYPVKLD